MELASLLLITHFTIYPPTTTERESVTYGKTNASIVAQYGLDGLVGERNVDLIIGGPPCQAYSKVGKIIRKLKFKKYGL